MTEELRIGGVRVERCAPATPGTGAQRPPLLLVHGGSHGSWCWANYLSYFSNAGWDTLALNWYGHGGSEDLAPEALVNRSICDVTEEIGLVAATLPRPPVVVGHSMGGLAAQVYAERNEVAGLVLIGSVVPEEVGGPVNEIPVDLSALFPVLPFEVAWQMFFQGVPEAVAREFYARLTPESPRAVWEATRWTVSVDRSKISCPVLVIGGETDILCPAEITGNLAAHYGAEYIFVPGRGHNIMLEPRWRETADQIAGWLGRLKVPAESLSRDPGGPVAISHVLRRGGGRTAPGTGSTGPRRRPARSASSRPHGTWPCS
jgi:pimeloyl-ACP methyl ester carboxylesterase